jgi:hypothetical protein
MLQYNLTTTQPAPLSVGLSSFLSVQVGSDTSNNFALSVNGLAVRTPSGRFVTKERSQNRLIDVTPLILPVNPYVYRLPCVAVEPGDLVVTADPPNFSALYVVSAHKGEEVEGLDICTSQIVRYIAPRSVFLQFYVKAVSLLDLFFGREP